MTPPPTGAGDVLLEPLPSLSIARVSHALWDLFGVTGTLTPLSGERDLNFRVVADDRESYVLKIAGWTEAAEAELHFQDAVLAHLARNAPGVAVPRAQTSATGAATVHQAIDGRRYLVRLLTFLPGKPAFEHPPSALLRQDVGRIAACLDAALASFEHPAADRPLIWDVARVAELEGHVALIGSPQERSLAGRVLDRFERDVRPRLAACRRQVIHNDLNQNNILVGEDGHGVVGVIDFGDCIRTHLVAELTIAAAHQLYRQEDVLKAAVEVIAGYAAMLPLLEDEIFVLPALIQARLLMRELIVAWRRARNPEASASYRSDVSLFGWQALAAWDALSEDEALAAVSQTASRA